MRRRTLVLGGLTAAAGLTLLARPADKGAPHPPYFRSLGDALDGADRAAPTMVVDRNRLRENIRTLGAHLKGRYDYRIVAKSLPSLPLLQEVMSISGSNRLMLFHQPFINQVARQFPQADILLGKPMPVTAAHNFYRQFKGNAFDPSTQLRWLLDSVERARQYDELAGALQVDMLACIEIDVGLHRGGVNREQQLLAMLELIQASPRLNFGGFMGYEPHIVKVPGDTLKYRDDAVNAYRRYVDVAKEFLGDAWPANALLNAGGSPTYQLYNEGQFPFNELATGSCLVKPADFDLPTLTDHHAASWIAAPVLKRMDKLQIPGIDLGKLQSLWDPNKARSYFLYGGYWKALPESPPGLSTNSLFGRSTNQEMLNGSTSIDLQPDDWIFLRPTQSEFVFLQFGDIAVYDEGQIVDHWPVFTAQA